MFGKSAYDVPWNGNELIFDEQKTFKSKYVDLKNFIPEAYKIDSINSLLLLLLSSWSNLVKFYLKLNTIKLFCVETATHVSFSSKALNEIQHSQRWQKDNNLKKETG